MIKKAFIVIPLLLMTGYIHADSVYSPNNCEYSVIFPGTPILTTVTDPNFGQRTTAKYGIVKNKKGYSLEADCTGGIKPKNTIQFNKDNLHKIISSNFKRLGVTNAKFSYSENELGKNMIGRGTMNIENTDILFVSSIYVGKHSFILLHTGTFSNTEQHPQVTKFINSLKYMEFLTLD